MNVLYVIFCLDAGDQSDSIYTLHREPILQCCSLCFHNKLDSHARCHSGFFLLWFYASSRFPLLFFVWVSSSSIPLFYLISFTSCSFLHFFVLLFSVYFSLYPSPSTSSFRLFPSLPFLQPSFIFHLRSSSTFSLLPHPGLLFQHSPPSFSYIRSLRRSTSLFLTLFPSRRTPLRRLNFFILSFIRTLLTAYYERGGWNVTVQLSQNT